MDISIPTMHDTLFFPSLFTETLGKISLMVRDRAMMLRVRPVKFVGHRVMHYRQRYGSLRVLLELGVEPGLYVFTQTHYTKCVYIYIDVPLLVVHLPTYTHTRCSLRYTMTWRRVHICVLCARAATFNITGHDGSSRKVSSPGDQCVSRLAMIFRTSRGIIVQNPCNLDTHYAKA